MSLLDDSDKIIDKDIFDLAKIQKFFSFEDGTEDKRQYENASRVLKEIKNSPCLQWLETQKSPAIFVKNKIETKTYTFDGPDGKERTYQIPILGEYFRKDGNSELHTPRIEIYDDAIQSVVGKDDNKYKCIFSIVLLHELMHAIMDSGDSTAEATMYKTLYGFWKEESYANAGVLNMVKNTINNKINKEFKPEVESFIKNQSGPYRYGLTVFANKDLDFDAWKEQKKYGNGLNKDEQKLWLIGLCV